MKPLVRQCRHSYTISNNVWSALLTENGSSTYTALAEFPKGLLTVDPHLKPLLTVLGNSPQDTVTCKAIA